MIFGFRFRPFQLNKKSELVEAKARQQIDTLLPVHLRDIAHRALTACKDVRAYSPHSIFQLIICIATASNVPFKLSYHSIRIQLQGGMRKGILLDQMHVRIQPGRFLVPIDSNDDGDDGNDDCNGDDVNWNDGNLISICENFIENKWRYADVQII